MTELSQVNSLDMFNKAHADETLPTFYFNTFSNGLSSADIETVLGVYNLPTARIIMSLPVAKEFAEKLGSLVARAQEAVGQRIPTITEINAKYLAAEEESVPDSPKEDA